MNKYNGFTLIELLIVIAIIGIIAAVAVPSYEVYMTKSRRADAHTELLKLASLQEKYYARNNVYSTVAADIGGVSVSKDGHYNLTITSTNTAAGFIATATAVTGGLQEGDTGCTVMTYDSVGRKEPDGNPATEEDCW